MSKLTPAQDKRLIATLERKFAKKSAPVRIVFIELIRWVRGAGLAWATISARWAYDPVDQTSNVVRIRLPFGDVTVGWDPHELRFWIGGSSTTIPMDDPNSIDKLSEAILKVMSSHHATLEAGVATSRAALTQMTNRQIASTLPGTGVGV